MGVLDGTKRGARLLTLKEQQFVLLVLEGHTKSSVFRQVYRSHNDAHVVSAGACPISRSDQPSAQP